MRIFNRTHSLSVCRSVLFVLIAVSGGLSTAQAQWTTSGNNISNSNSGNVGVGTATPGSLLEVKKDQATGTEIRVNNFSTSGFAGSYFNGGFAQTTGGFIQWNNTTGLNNLFVGTGGSAPLYLGTNNTPRFTILPTSGNVGIGTMTPGYRLDVQGGSINSSGGLCIAGDCKTAWSQITGSSQWSTSGSTINYAGGNVGISNTSPVAKLHVSGVGTSGTAAFAGTNNTSHFNHGNGTEDTYIRGGKTTSRVIINDSASGVVLLAQGGGNVGVGTGSPTSKLHVAGTGRFTGDLTVDGNIAAKYQDVAEWVPAVEQLAAGTVVVLDPSKSNHVISSSKSYDTRVAGVISAQPGIMLGEKGDDKVLVATTGRVLVNVDATNGPIEIGDLLVTSDREGVAMKSQPVEFGGVRLHRPGTLIGKALEPLSSGTGKILVLLSLQ
jgi:hypothetical protein